MQNRHKNVQWVAWSATNTYKTQKLGLIKGVIKEIRMFADIFSFAGVSAFAKQFSTFARKECIVNSSSLQCKVSNL